MAFKQTLQDNRAFYGRVALSLVLFVLFIVFSVSALLSDALQEWPWLLGGLLIGSVLILPRSARRPRKTDEQQATGLVEYWRKVEKWLTMLRLAYLIVAIFVWVALPKLVA